MKKVLALCLAFALCICATIAAAELRSVEENKAIKKHCETIYTYVSDTMERVEYNEITDTVTATMVIDSKTAESWEEETKSEAMREYYGNILTEQTYPTMEAMVLIGCTPGNICVELVTGEGTPMLRAKNGKIEWPNATAQEMLETLLYIEAMNKTFDNDAEIKADFYNDVLIFDAVLPDFETAPCNDNVVESMEGIAKEGAMLKLKDINNKLPHTFESIRVIFRAKDGTVIFAIE